MSSSEFSGYPIRHTLDLEALPEGQISRFWMDLVANGIGQDILVPVVVAKGAQPGPVVGLTAVVHGNELNGLKIIQRLFGELDPATLVGTVVGVPVVNVPSILNYERRFNDGEDLNRIMPGSESGNRSQVYAARIVSRIVSRFDYLLDLHTASFGRVNSYYIRANMKSRAANKLALLQNAEIILNNEGADGTLRAAASDLGIHAITLEVGDPNRFQKGVIRSGLEGVYNVLADLGVTQDEVQPADEPAVICPSSKWLYADRGGILEVKVDLIDRVQAGQPIATIRDIFGKVIRHYEAPYDGIVIGKSTHPVGQTGSRIVHLGRLS